MVALWAWGAGALRPSYRQFGTACAPRTCRRCAALAQHAAFTPLRRGLCHAVSSKIVPAVGGLGCSMGKCCFVLESCD
eukprot:5622217-Alexandrium_andersonii.AAC.1